MLDVVLASIGVAVCGVSALVLGILHAMMDSDMRRHLGPGLLAVAIGLILFAARMLSPDSYVLGLVAAIVLLFGLDRLLHGAAA